MRRHIWKNSLDDLDGKTCYLIVKGSTEWKLELVCNVKYLIDRVELRINRKGMLWLIATPQTKFWREKRSKVDDSPNQEGQNEVMDEALKKMMEFSLDNQESAKKVELLDGFALFESDSEVDSSILEQMQKPVSPSPEKKQII